LETPDWMKNGFGTTRVIRAMNFPGAKSWNPVERRYDDDTDPTSSVGTSGGDWIYRVGTAPVTTDSYSDGMWQSERHAAEREAQKAVDYDELCKRAAAAAAAGRWR
jgi:hypothetical protein